MNPYLFLKETDTIDRKDTNLLSFCDGVTALVYKGWAKVDVSNINVRSPRISFKLHITIHHYCYHIRVCDGIQ